MRKRRSAGASRTGEVLEENGSELKLAAGPAYRKQRISRDFKEVNSSLERNADGDTDA
jgi:hypothetical protein